MIIQINYDDVELGKHGTRESILNHHMVCIQNFAARMSEYGLHEKAMAEVIDEMIREVLVFKSKQSPVVDATVSPGQAVASLIVPPGDGSGVETQVEPKPATPTETGKLKYPPDGYDEEMDKDHEYLQSGLFFGLPRRK